MKKKVFGELKESLTGALGHARGKITLKTKNVSIPEAPKVLEAKEILRIRKRFGVSQAVFARILGVARNTAITWEKGRCTPSGPALRLLEIAKRHPEDLTEA